MLTLWVLIFGWIFLHQAQWADIIGTVIESISLGEEDGISI